MVRPLIGRDAQLDSIAELLGGVRLLSLIGPGGAGKTSLALATVVRTSANYPDGAFGVRLASVNTPDQVPVAVADALGMPMDGAAATRDLRDRLISFLTRRRMLLLVDNCEHVVDAAAVLIDDILSRCPGITVITTSREALAIPDEVQVTVGPLETPPEDTPPGKVLDYPAAQLFAERARAVRPGLLFDADNLTAIGAITRSLDGIPLALELAAARVSTLSPVEVSQRLANRFTLLTSGARTAEERQQTLRATVDWSYQLLSETEQRVFDRLSVFQGGWTLMSAEDVVARRGHAPRRGPRHRRPARRTVHGRRRTRPHQPVPDAGDAASVRRRTTPGVRAGGRGGAPPRRLLPRASSSTPKLRCAGTSNGRRCGCCATSNPTSAPPWHSSAARTATATPP